MERVDTVDVEAAGPEAVCVVEDADAQQLVQVHARPVEGQLAARQRSQALSLAWRLAGLTNKTQRYKTTVEGQLAARQRRQALSLVWRLARLTNNTQRYKKASITTHQVEFNFFNSNENLSFPHTKKVSSHDWMKSLTDIAEIQSHFYLFKCY